MNLTPEQLMAVHRANVEALVGMTRQAFSGMEQLMELNMSLTKTVMSEAHQLSVDALSAKDTQELLALQTGLLAPMTQKILSYQQELTQMAQALGGDLGTQAKSQSAQGQARIQKWMPKDELAPINNAAPMFNAFKIAVEVGSEALEGVQKAFQGASALLGEPLKSPMHAPVPTGEAPASRPDERSKSRSISPASRPAKSGRR